jgi:hypothetical protein
LHSPGSPRGKSAHQNFSNGASFDGVQVRVSAVDLGEDAEQARRDRAAMAVAVAEEARELERVLLDRR